MNQIDSNFKSLDGKKDIIIQAIEKCIANPESKDFKALFNSFDVKLLGIDYIVEIRNYLYNNQQKFQKIAELHNFWGKIEKQLKMPEPAMECFKNALSVNPNYIESLRELGFLLAESGKLDKAMDYFADITVKQPTDWMAWNDGGCTLRAMNQIEQAIKWMKAACVNNPTYATLYANVALLEYEEHNYDEAQIYLDKAFEIEPNNPEALHTQAMLFGAIGEHEKSYEWDIKALDAKPDYPQARLGLALSALTLGNLSEGFMGYEHRWVGSDKSDVNTLPTLLRPQWVGQKVYSSSAIALLAEQGFGDMIQLARFIPLLLKYFRKIELFIPNELARLVAYNYSSDRVNIYTNIADIDTKKVDYEIPFLSLPLALGITLENLPNETPYLSVNQENTLKWQERLSSIKGLKVGLAWTGKPTLGKQKLRSIDTKLLEVLNTDNIVFVSLQKGAAEKPKLNNFVDYMDECIDFMDTAALISNLDLVISVDTSVAHLAAALGKPTWLLNRLGSEWRWMDKQITSPWYPTMKIYNQTKLGDWSEILELVKIDLVNYTSHQLHTH